MVVKEVVDVKEEVVKVKERVTSSRLLGEKEEVVEIDEVVL